MLLFELASRLGERRRAVAGQRHGGRDLAVVFEKLYRVPALFVLCDGVGQKRLHRADRALHLLREYFARQVNFLCLRDLDRLFDERVEAGLFKRGGLDYRAVEKHRKALRVDLDAALREQVGHVERDDDGDARLDELRREVEVSFDVRRVDEVDYNVGAIFQKIVAADDLLERVGRKRVNAGKVCDYDFLAGLYAFQLSFFLFDRDPGPVAYVLVRAGHGVEHGSLAAVRVAGKRESHGHCCCLLEKFLLRKIIP